ncbi:hypothetical protein [Actinoplanes sp. NPDC051851]|uniref:hypothetical protein n=1 Tax=Actinoplanes sp. NPDC051851 TaxID=3154753 RepID=UPI003412289B
MVMVLMVAAVGLTISAGLIIWPRLSDWRDRRAVPEPVAPPRVGRFPLPPFSLEGVLTAQLLTGEISRRQYIRALENLAARDEERSPLTIPRDDRS